jgi:ubiquinone/menaquinone biosynthesis C-methylase UbiE
MISKEELTSNIVFDQIAADYGLDYESSYTQYLKYLLLKRHIKNTDVCLEIGIANGIFSIPLSKDVTKVYGIDISPAMIKECFRNVQKAKANNVFIYEMSASSLSFEDSTFDLVFSFSTLLLVPDVQSAFKEIVRVLKPGGLTILDITGRYNLSQGYWGRYYRQQGHWGVHSFSLKQITSILKSLGFELLEVHPTGLTDNWKYVKWLKNSKLLERIFHNKEIRPDLDYRISRLIPGLANRWYIVLRLKEKII